MSEQQTAVDTRTCTCHPDDGPPQPCPRQYALSECRQAALLAETEDAIVFLRNRDRQPYEQRLLEYFMRVRDVIER